MSSTDPAIEFRENLAGLTTIQPAAQHVQEPPTIKVGFNERARIGETSVEQMGMNMQATMAPVMQPQGPKIEVDMENLQLQTEALRQPAEGIKVSTKTSDLTEGMGQTYKMGAELGGQILSNLFGGPKDEPQMDPVPQFRPQPAAPGFM